VLAKRKGKLLLALLIILDVKKVHYKVSFQVELKKNHQDINKTFPMRT
jgi:hypothetical protein